MQKWPKWDNKIAKILIITLLFLFILQLVYLAKTTFPTSDEYAYIAPAYSYIETGSFKLNTEHPPLLKLIMALPLQFLKINFPYQHPSWKKAKLFGEDGFYKEFIFKANNDNKETMLFLARITTIILSLLLAIIIFIWSKELFGKWAGVLALLIYVFDPNIIAYSSIVMTDIGFTLFATISFYTLWKFIKTPSSKNYVIAAVALGATQLTKFTAIFLFGIYPVIFITYFLAKKITAPRIFKKNKATFLILSYLGMTVISILIINSVYGFKGTFQTAQQMFENDNNIDKTIYTPDKMFGNNKLLKLVIENLPIPLPYYYVKGLGYVLVESKSPRTTYLFGKTSNNGFWYYYLLSFLIKTPISILILITASIIYFVIYKKKLENDLVLIIPTVIYIFLLSINQKQIGIRHILQVYPLIIIFTSRIINIGLIKKKIGKIIILILAILMITETTSAFPDYISYANTIIGLKQAYLYFGDSNINLGQDTPLLINFIKNNPDTKAALTQDILENYAQYKQLHTCQEGLAAIDATNLNINKEYAWLKCKTPIQRLGRTIFIYNITKC